MSAPAQPIKRHPDKEYLSAGQRVGEVIGAVCILLVIAYFAYSFNAGTGFFTAAFGPWEQFWFFGPMVASLAAPMIRVTVGRRNPARLFEIATNLLLAVGSFWLFIVFPFDFSHLGDALPWGLSFLLNWVPDWLGRIALALQVVIGLIVAVVTTWRYFSVRGRE